MTSDLVEQDGILRKKSGDLAKERGGRGRFSGQRENFPKERERCRKKFHERREISRGKKWGFYGKEGNDIADEFKNFGREKERFRRIGGDFARGRGTNFAEEKGFREG